MIFENIFKESDLFGGNTEVNYLENVEAIPIREGEHPVNACFRLTLENEQNWFNIMSTIAVSEMAFMENNNATEVVYEGVDVKKIAATIVQWIKAQWAKLKGVFEAAISKFTSAVASDKKLMEQYKVAVKRPALQTKTYSVKGRIFTFEDAKKIPDHVAAAFVGNSELNKYLNASTDDAPKLKATWAEDKGKILNKTRAKIVNDLGGEGGESVTASEFSGKLTSAIFTGKDTDHKIKVQDAYKAIRDDGGVNAIKEAFKKVNKEFNTAAATAKQAEKIAKTKSEKLGSLVDVIGFTSDIIKAQINILNSASGATIRAASRHYGVMRSVLRKAITGSKPVGESAEFEEATEIQDDAICSII